MLRMNFTWSISEKWTFFGLIFPSSDSESLLLGSWSSKLGFFRRDLRGVALDCGRSWRCLVPSSIMVGSSTELQIAKDIVFLFLATRYYLSSSNSPVVGIGVTFPEVSNAIGRSIPTEKSSSKPDISSSLSSPRPRPGTDTTFASGNCRSGVRD